MPAWTQSLGENRVNEDPTRIPVSEAKPDQHQADSAWMPPDLLSMPEEAWQAAVERAGVGDGNMTHTAIEGLAQAAKRGVVAVVRSSRSGSGAVARKIEVDDDGLGFVASMELNPQKARVLLLGLMKTNEPRKLQALFYQY